MTRRLSWLISSVTISLLVLEISLFPVQGAASIRTTGIANERFQLLSKINNLQDSSQLFRTSPGIQKSELTVKDSLDKTAVLEQSRLISTTAGSQINLPLILKPQPDERAALMAFYDSADGDRWLNNYGWNTNSSICTWYGVTCDITGNVSGLILTSNLLSGTLSPQIGNLVNLQSLNLSYNFSLSGPIPPEMGNLVNLQSLDLSNNSSLSGPIPSEIGKLVNLQMFYLYNNQLMGSIPPEIGNLVNLQRLYFYNNLLSGPIPAEIGNLVNLQELYLSGNQLSGPIPAEIGSLVNLQWLYLHNNQLSGIIPPEIGNLVNLQLFTVSNNQLSGPVPAEISKLTNLQWLYLDQNPSLLCWETQEALNWAVVLPVYYGPILVC